ncbi:MAG: hypothetical protein ABIX01_08290 [Chitinophagaceae bacterium]
MSIKSFKQIFQVAAFAVLVAGAFSSCKKNNVSVDVDPLVAPDAAEFIPQTNLYTYTYFIKSTENPFIIPIGITNVSQADRSIGLTYTSRNAVSGTQYTAPTAVTIKAGKAVDSIVFQGKFAGYPSGRKDTVKVKFVGPTVAGRDSFQLIIQGYCDVIAANLSGSYPKSTDTYGGSASTRPNYNATVSNWVSTGATSASIIIKNMGATSDNGWGPFGATDPAVSPGLTATLDWSNPANFSVTVPLQNYFDDGSGMSTITATGVFSACDNTFTVTCKVKYAGNGSTYTHISYLRR